VNQSSFLSFNPPFYQSFDSHSSCLLSLLSILFQLLFPHTLHKVFHTLAIFCSPSLYFRTCLVLGHIFDLKLYPYIAVVGIFVTILERICSLEELACTIVVGVVEEALAFDIEGVEDTFDLEEAGIFCLAQEDIFGPGVEDTFFVRWLEELSVRAIFQVYSTLDPFLKVCLCISR
jgi:hypothetical protein